MKLTSRYCDITIYIGFTRVWYPSDDMYAAIQLMRTIDMSCVYVQCSCLTTSKERPASSRPLLGAQFPIMPQSIGTLTSNTKFMRHMPAPLVAMAQRVLRGNTDTTASTSDGDNSGVSYEKAAKGSGTTARGRRLLKVREEKRKREFEHLHKYPAWAKVLEDACRNDSELRAVLGDSIGNPELMRKRVKETSLPIRKKLKELDSNEELLKKELDRRGEISKNLNPDQSLHSKSALESNVSFSRIFNPLDSYIWFELYGSPSDRDVDLLGSVIQSWYVMGRLGAFNSTNLQLASSSMEYNPLYDEDKGFKVMPSSFHDIGDVEFQDNWGRVWYESFRMVDLGTADFFSIDVLLNCLTVLSSEYLGIQQVVFGGRRMGDWENGMTSPDFGYKSFKI
ncbi:hypothetical protein ACJIZ3_017252 [Penstemon smallii]|uniref:DUF3531 domain-containing protein n=1 Tax=Penstemon smallii TaxID=265156 RepID=A0ABD3SVE4_9LAMI